MGIVEDFKKGQRVVISTIIACSCCEYSKQKQYSACDNINPNKRNGSTDWSSLC